MFKENSRFASLIEDKPVNNSKNEQQNKVEKEYKEKKDNSFKNDKPYREYSSFNKSYKERMEDSIKKIKEEEIIKKAQEERRKEEERKIALAIESFPELLVKSSIKEIENTANFIEKLKTSVKVDIQVKNSIKEGWTELTRDKVSNSTIMVSNINNRKNEYIKTPEDLAYDVLDHLVFLHEDRKNEYINCWGEDEWEKMFTFPNYDYHYFDKLDEIYAKKYPEFEDEEFEEDEYWKKY